MGEFRRTLNELLTEVGGSYGHHILHAEAYSRVVALYEAANVAKWDEHMRVVAELAAERIRRERAEGRNESLTNAAIAADARTAAERQRADTYKSQLETCEVELGAQIAAERQRAEGWKPIDPLPPVGGTYLVGGYRPDLPGCFDWVVGALIHLETGPVWYLDGDKMPTKNWKRFPLEYWCEVPRHPRAALFDGRRPSSRASIADGRSTSPIRE